MTAVQDVADATAAGPGFHPITDADLATFARGRVALTVFGLRPVYYRLLRENKDQRAQIVARALRGRDPDGPDHSGRIRGSALQVGAYQIWEEVQRSQEVFDRMMFGLLGTGVIGGILGAVFYVETNSLWYRLVYGAVAAVSAIVVAFVSVAVADSQTPASRTVRTFLGLVGLALWVASAWLLSRWDSVIGQALFSGVAIAVVMLFAVGLFAQIARLLISAAYRRSRTKWTADEIIDKLTVIYQVLDEEAEPHCLRNAARRLEHVAICAERFLPGYLMASSYGMATTSLLQRTRGDFAEIAAGVRAFGTECLLPHSNTRESVKTEVSRLLTAAVETKWGEWPRGRAEETAWPARWRLWTAGAFRFTLALLPTILVGAVALYYYQTDPASPWLKPEVLIPALAATFGVFTALLTTGRTQHSDQKRIHLPWH